jgi:LETM1 and EF-hand domain-containing protein 1
VLAPRASLLIAHLQVLDHVVELTQDMGLGIVIDDDAKKILNKGAEIKEAQPLKPRKEDIISD